MANDLRVGSIGRFPPLNRGPSELILDLLFGDLVHFELVPQVVGSFLEAVVNGGTYLL